MKALPLGRGAGKHDLPGGVEPGNGACWRKPRHVRSRARAGRRRTAVSDSGAVLPALGEAGEGEAGDKTHRSYMETGFISL